MVQSLTSWHGTRSRSSDTGEDNMSLVLTGQEHAFQSRARKFAHDHIAPIAEKIETEGIFLFEILSKMGQQGLLAPFPRRDGGTGLGWAHEVIVAEEVSAVSAAVRDSATRISSAVRRPSGIPWK